jgi:cysteine-rich repeat protein
MALDSVTTKRLSCGLAAAFSVCACGWFDDLHAKPPGCGNGTHEPGEQCDDGNAVDLDGCKQDCQFSEGLLAHWRFDDPSGTMAREERGQFPATLFEQGASSPAGFVASGKVKGAVLLNDETFVELTNFRIDREAGSVSLWVATTHPDYLDYQHILWGGSSGDGWDGPFDREFHVSINSFIGNPAHFATFVTGVPGEQSTACMVASNLLISGNWYHLVFTYWDASTATKCAFYIDGTQVTGPNSDPNSTHPARAPLNFTGWLPSMYLGRDGDGSSRRLRGYVDELLIFDRVLDAAEVRTLYEAQK